MARALGMQPKAPNIAGPTAEQIALQEEQANLLRQQSEALKRQEAEAVVAAAKTEAVAVETAATTAAATETVQRQRRGRVSLLNTDTGIVLTPSTSDLQRRLGG